MPDTVSVGPFLVDEEIGEGGMGRVYRGVHRTTEVPVALKVIEGAIDPSTRRRFHREVQAHARLQHPGIVYLYEYGELGAETAAATSLEEGSPYVAMELAERGTVRDALPASNWEVVFRWLVQILDALAYAHARGVVHRDLKPENFLLFDRDGCDERTGDGGRVKLADFGIAHAFGAERDAETDELETAAGTPLYMPPEQLHGRWRAYGPWTDVYALGCIAWELACGRPPFTGHDWLSIAVKHETQARPPLDPQFPVPDEFQSWIHRAMSVEPERRFRRAADAAWALPRGVLAEAGSVDRADAPGDDSAPAATKPRLSEVPTLTRTITLASEGAAHDPTRRLFDKTKQAEGLAETKLEGEVDGPCAATQTNSDPAEEKAPKSDGASDRAIRILEESHPPIRDDWRPEQTEPMPAPLIGTGLGLLALREPPFVDRDRESDRIWENLQMVVEEGQSRFVFITGEVGIGKSRLAEWMATRAHEVGAATVLRAVHTPEGGRRDGISAALDRTLRTLKMDRGEVYEHLCEGVPRLAGPGGRWTERDARALTEYLRPTGATAERVEGPRYRFTDARQRRALVVRILDRLSRRRPLYLWLDDLQWGADAIGVLEHLREPRTSSPRMLVVATLRADTLREAPELQNRIKQLSNSQRADALSVEPLAKPHQRKLLDGLLPLEDDLADAVAERTEGHPLFAMQLLGHWIDRGDLEIGPSGFRVPDARGVELPDDIHKLWKGRIARLVDRYSSGEQSGILQAIELGAALGREVDSGEWKRLLDEAELRAPVDLVDRLVERGLATWTEEGWAFAHGLVVDSLARGARDAGRWKRHQRRCARMLENELTEEVPGPRERIADHWIEAGELRRALELFLEEAQLLYEREDYDERARLLNRRRTILDRLDFSDDHSRSLEQRLEQARSRLVDGDPKSAGNMGRDVWERLDEDQVQLRAETALFLAVCERDIGNRDASKKWAHDALEASAAEEIPRFRARCHMNLAWTWMWDGDAERAELHAQRALELAEQTGSRHEELYALRIQGFVWKERGNPEVIDLYERLRQESAEEGYVYLEGQALNGLGEFARFSDEPQQARRYYRRFLDRARETYRRQAEAVGELNLAMVEIQARAFGRARTYLEDARSEFEAIDQADSREAFWTLLPLAHAAGVGDEGEFRRLYTRIEEGWPEDWRLIRDYPWLLEMTGEYALESGWTEEASRIWRLARDLWIELGDDAAAERLDERVERMLP